MAQGRGEWCTNQDVTNLLAEEERCVPKQAIQNNVCWPHPRYLPSSHGSNSRPPGLPRISRREGPRQHTTPLATAGDTPGTPSKCPPRPFVALVVPSLSRATAPSHTTNKASLPRLPTSTPTNSCLQPQSVSGLSLPLPRPPSLTKSPPPMAVETFPHSADLEDSGRVERKRREIGQVRPPQICSR